MQVFGYAKTVLKRRVNEMDAEQEDEFYSLTKNFDLEDWRELRDEHYWWTLNEHGTQLPRFRYSKLKLIRYYVKHGVRSPRYPLFKDYENLQGLLESNEPWFGVQRNQIKSINYGKD